MPQLRGSTLKYKQPATTELTAIATVESESKERFMRQYLRRGKAVLTIEVELKDNHGVTTMVSAFSWYVQRSLCTKSRIGE